MALGVPGFPVCADRVADGRYKRGVFRTQRQWAGPALQKGIGLGIKANRMGSFYLDFCDSKGRPAKVENVSINLKKHEFLFGMQAFLAEGFHHIEKDPEPAAQKIRGAFRKPFKLRFRSTKLRTSLNRASTASRAKITPDICRRPPPDVVLEMCERDCIMPKGHCLLWHIASAAASRPEWAPENRLDLKSTAI